MNFFRAIRNKNESRKVAAITSILGTYSSLIVNIINGIIMIPLFLHFFGSDLYGTWLATAGMISMFALLEGGINQVITQRLARSYSRGKHVTFRLNLSSGIIINTGVILCMFLLGLIFSTLFPFFIHTNKSNYNVIGNSIILASLGSALTLYQNTLFSPFYAWQKVFIATIVSNGTSILGIIINLILLYAGYGIISISISIFINGLVGFLLAIFFVKKEMHARYKSNWFIFKFKHIQLVLKKCIPLYLNTIVSTVSGNIEPVLIASYINSTAVVIYNVTFKLVSLSTLPISAIAGSIIGSASHLFGENNKVKQREIVHSLISIQAIISVIMLSVVVMVNKDFVSIWVGDKFYGGDLLTILFVFQILSNTRFNLFTSLIQATGEFKITSIGGIVASITKLLFIFFLIMNFKNITILPLATFLSIFSFAFFYYPIRMAGFLRDNKINWYGIKEIIIGIILVSILLFFPYPVFNWFQLGIKSFLFAFIAFFTLYLLSKNVRFSLIYLKKSFFKG